jgi:hypothetical protein
MTSRERLTRAFHCQETDRLPVRLWGVDRPTCEALIEELTECQFLARTKDGAVVLNGAV